MGARPMPFVAGVEHRFVEARGVRFHVAEAGEGEPVVFLHGFPQHWYAWRHLVPLLAGDHRLIMPDLRGSGWSDAPSRGYDTGGRVEDVLALMDALGLDRVRLVGHDWGAWTGFMACLRAPERFEHHLALNMSHPWAGHRTMIKNAWRMWHTALWEYPLIGAAVLRHWPGFTRFFLRRGVSDPDAWSQADLEEFTESVRPAANAHAGRALHWQYVLRDIPRLATGQYRRASLTVPTMVMGGAEDVVVPPEALPGGGVDVQVIDGAGHFLAAERPGLVAAAVRERRRELTG